MNTHEKKNFANSCICRAMRNPFVKNKLNALKQHDEYTFRHSINVATESIYLALNFNLNDEQFLNLTYAALMHDIGKIGISLSILNKNGYLTTSEYEIIKLHPLVGAKQIRDSHLFSDDVVAGVLMHHENYDGTGYYNFTENNINLYSKIIRIADTFDAMTDKRPYHLPKKESTVINEMQRFKGFDPDMLSVFVQSPNKGKKIYIDKTNI